MRRFVRISAAVFAAVLLTSLMSGCSTTTGAIDKIGLYYTGGPLQGKHFKRLVLPGTGASFVGFADPVKWLPVNVRSYIVSKNPAEGDRATADFIPATTKDHQRVQWQLTATFKLNFDRKVIRQFYEQVCTKFKCTNLSQGGGWDHLLDAYFRKPIENSLQTDSLGYDAIPLRDDPAIRQALQEKLATTLKGEVNNLLGGPYFCGPGADWRKPSLCPDFKIILQQPDLPDALANQLEANQASQARIVQAQNDAQVRKQEAEGDALAQQVQANSLTGPYLEKLRIDAMNKCAASPNCTLIVNGSSGGVNVNTGK